MKCTVLSFKLHKFFKIAIRWYCLTTSKTLPGGIDLLGLAVVVHNSLLYDLQPILSVCCCCSILLYYLHYFLCLFREPSYVFFRCQVGKNYSNFVGVSKGMKCLRVAYLFVLEYIHTNNIIDPYLLFCA